MDIVLEPVPSHCPGTESKEAGQADSCAGCPNRVICASGVLRQPDPAIAQIGARLSTVKRKIFVMSGKGGVGKSTVSCQLSYALQSMDYEIGLLDVDICGPSVPKIMGLEGQGLHQSMLGWEPVYLEDNLAVVSVGFMLNDPNQAIIWRGPKKNTLIKQFLRDVYWNELDYLIVDTPPGTSDEHLSIVTYLKEANPDGVIMVTTPQEVALLDVRKEINFCKKVRLPILGVIENMSGFVCPKCHVESQIFPPSSGGAKKMCEEMDVPFLGSIPLDPLLARSCDEGKYFMSQYPDSLATKAYQEIIQKILTVVPVPSRNETENQI